MMTDDRLTEEICELVKEYTGMEMGYFFRYDLKDKINQYYEDNCIQDYEDDYIQEVDEDD